LSHIDTGDVLLVITAVGDVAKQKLAVKNAQLTAAIVQYSDDAIIGSTLAGVITSWNPAAERMYGYSPMEIIGKYANMLLPDDRAGEMQANLGAVRGGQAVQRLETIRVRKDGTEVPVSITVAPIRDEDGVVVGASAVHRDVTEQRQAFEASQRMSAIVESSDDAIFGSTLEGTITSWNPAAARLFGYSSEEIIGTSGKLLSPGDHTDEIRTILAKVGSGQPIEHLETIRIRKDGTVFPVSLTVSPIRGVEGAVVGASAICRDVTQQRQAFETAQRIAAIVESSEDAIIGETLAGVITSWNPAAARMFGYSGAEIIGKSARLLVPEDQADEFKSILAKINAGQRVEHLETFNVQKDGTVFPISLTVSPIRDDGTFVGASVICRDMTEQQHVAQYARSLIEAALDPLMTISPEGKINDVNEATVKITGVPRSKLIGTDFSGYFTDPDQAHQGYQRAFTQGSVTDYPLTLRHRDGTLTDVLYNASVYRDTSGNVLGVCAAAREVAK